VTGSGVVEKRPSMCGEHAWCGPLAETQRLEVVGDEVEGTKMAKNFMSWQD
jgi:hypothetical protein